MEVNKLHSFTGHSDCVYALQASSEPHLFFSGGGDGMVVLWDLLRPDQGQLIAKVAHSCYALHYREQEDVLIAGHNYEGIHQLDWRAKKEMRSLKVTQAAIFDIQSHGNDLFVASGDGTVTVVDLPSWQIKDRIALSSKSARTLAMSVPRNELAIGYSDHTIRIVDLETRKLKYDWQAHQNSVFTLAYAPDGQILLSGARDARLKAWDPGRDYALEGEVVAHLYAINHVAFSPNAKHFVTCSLDKSIKVWDSSNLRLLKVIDKSRHAGHGTSVNKLLWTTFNNRLLSASDDRTISVWDLIFSQD